MVLELWVIGLVWCICMGNWRVFFLILPGEWNVKSTLYLTISKAPNLHH